ncbi:gastrin-releasing peptide [Osmerus mordax]|uniref:gastrin-releasing peptide n=1 Tax=Osmerus mordax TaxID=8014 RepID=UPI00350F3CEE
MGEIGHPWIYKPSSSMVVILLSITCVMQCSENPATIENVYPRGNHWAVGHLMGKKSLDGLSGAEERAQASDHVRLPEENKRPSRLYGSLLLGQEAQRQPPLRLALFRSRQQEQQERDVFIQQLESLLLQVLNTKENSSS